MTINSGSTLDGAKVVQNEYTNDDAQLWKVVEASEGYFYIINKNSNKYLEIIANSSEDGALAGQWGITGYACQEWKIVKEGMN